jgi:hypothetical protein
VSAAGVTDPSTFDLCPVATMCQIDPTVLISSPVPCVVFFDATIAVLWQMM